MPPVGDGDDEEGGEDEGDDEREEEEEDEEEEEKRGPAAAAVAEELADAEWDDGTEGADDQDRAPIFNCDTMKSRSGRRRMPFDQLAVRHANPKKKKTNKNSIRKWRDTKIKSQPFGRTRH